jgi:hypothetical protein
MFDVFDVLMEIAPTNKPRRPGFTRTTALSTDPRKFSMVCWALRPQTSLEDPDSLGRRRYRLTRGNFQWFVGHCTHKQASVTRLRPEGGVIDWPVEIFNGLLGITPTSKPP